MAPTTKGCVDYFATFEPDKNFFDLLKQHWDMNGLRDMHLDGLSPVTAGRRLMDFKTSSKILERQLTKHRGSEAWTPVLYTSRAHVLYRLT